jgi:uncharacterized phage protein (TIGR01671 family)
MSRVIKFRAWDIREKQMIQADKLVLSTSEGCRPFLEDLEALKGEFEIMQFTGLHDRNGKEIYDKDIVGYNLGDRMSLELVEIKLQEIRTNGGHGEGDLVHVFEGVVINPYFGPITNHQVVGNIYEHPELLRSK